MNWEQRFKGEFISAKEIGDRRPTFTIAKIGTVKMDDEKKRKEIDKAVIWFKEIDRGFVFSKTAGHALAAMFGKDDNDWIGKRVTLYADPDVMLGGDQVGGIRVMGSPDIQKEIKLRIKFPKKRAIEVNLVQTAAPKQEKRDETFVPIK
jgi:hypothetical protein